MRRDWRWMFTLVCCWSCAGNLDNPERFDFLLNRDGGTASGTGAVGGRTTAGTSGRVAGATGGGTGVVTSAGRSGSTGMSDSGTSDSGTNMDAGMADGGSKSDAGSTSTTPPACVTTLFASSCATSIACHSKGAPQVDLESADVASRLIGKKSEATACMGNTFITLDGTPSLLAQKLNDGPPCGSKMPIGPALTTQQISCVTDWVSSVSGGK